MMRWSMVVVLAACGPQVDVPAGDGSTGDDGTSTSGVTVGNTRGDDSSPPVTTAMPPPSTTVADDGPNPSTTSGDDTTSDEGDVDSGEDMCDCQGRPTELRTVLEEGHSAADVLELVESTSYPWRWWAIEGQPETTLQIDVVYEGGAVTDEVGGCCGSFLCVPCPYGVTIEAFLRITSADGRLDEYLPATVTGSISPEASGDGVQNVSAQIAIGSLMGSLPSEMFTDRNGAVIVDTIQLGQSFTWGFDDVIEQHAFLVGYPPAAILGESTPP